MQTIFPEVVFSWGNRLDASVSNSNYPFALYFFYFSSLLLFFKPEATTLPLLHLQYVMVLSQD
jgi:hypothetical protein